MDKPQVQGLRPVTLLVSVEVFARDSDHAHEQVADALDAGGITWGAITSEEVDEDRGEEEG